MPSRIVRTSIDNTVEKNMLIGLIVSDEFCRMVLPAVKKDYLRIDYSWTIIKWVKEYWDEYKKSPGKQIQDIYLDHKKELKGAQGEIIRQFLNELSSTFEKESFNDRYHQDKALDLLRQRALELHTALVKGLIETGNIEEAEKEVRDFKNVSKSTSRWVDPFDKDYIDHAFSVEEETLFRLEGVLGNIVGDFKRGWLAALMGPMKRGKTWWLQEFAFTAITNKKKVALITLEMEDTQIALRSYKRMAALGDSPKEFLYPVFDCDRNQKGLCKRKCRVNTEKMPEDLQPDGKYKPCSACREEYSKWYVPAIWHKRIYREGLNVGRVTHFVKTFQQHFGHNLFRVKSHSIGTANVQDILNDLDVLEYSEDFVPDVIIIDYADILGPEDPRLTGRDAINETWKNLKSLAQQRKCLVCTATQSNRQSIEQRNVRAVHTGEDIRKLAHCDLMCVLNQKPKEKRAGYMRVGMIAHRHIFFDEFVQAQILQQLRTGQPFLDGEIMRKKEDEDEDDDSET